MRAVLLFVLLLAGAAQAAPLYLASVSAYCPCAVCCGKWSKHGLTKVGRRPVARRTVAADPRVFPLGSCLRIGNHRYHVEDVGSAIKGLRVDIFHETHQEALEFGRKKLFVARVACN